MPTPWKYPGQTNSLRMILPVPLVPPSCPSTAIVRESETWNGQSFARVAATTPGLPALPTCWPLTDLALGLADAPGGAASLQSVAPFQLRYQYLAGGVNTGEGWQTWNTNGTFV